MTEWPDIDAIELTEQQRNELIDEGSIKRVGRPFGSTMHIANDNAYQQCDGMKHQPRRWD